MKILIFNWRDIKNPTSGGAEVLTHEIAKRWVKWGHRVTQFSSRFSGCLKEEVVDGVKILRSGHPDTRYLFSSVHFLAFWYYITKFRGEYDIVIDEIHGIPFFTPWYVKEKKIALICEVAGNLWVKTFGLFFGLLGRAIEKIYLQFVYKNIPYLTISNSTKEELIKEGVNGKDITVLPMGLTIPQNFKRVEKEKDPTLIFVGRIAKSKGIEDAIKALEKVSKKYFKVKLWIVGGGEKKYIGYLKEMAKKLNVSDRITFWGYISQGKKFELMGRAHLLVVPSSKEGWGLIVPEAGFMGTPAVGYNVPGIRNVIQNHKTGYLTSKNNPLGLARNINKALRNKSEYEKLRKTAKKLSLSYNWDKTAKVALNEIFMGIK